jgi:hypothetical protein
MVDKNFTSLSGSLADESTNKMTAGPGARDVSWMKAYMETLIKPFSTTLKSPKLLDGEIKNMAAINLRATGEIICSTTMNTNIIIFPGLTNVMCYCVDPQGTDNNPITNMDRVIIDGCVFKQHLSTASDRAIVHLARLTGAGARFF